MFANVDNILVTLTIGELLKRATKLLKETSPGARVDAQVLLCHALQCSSAFLISHSEESISDEQLAYFNSLLQQRRDGQPVAYLTGTREFWSLDIAVTRDTLVPRPETETLVEYILDLYPADATNADKKVSDMGTGSGAIALALAHERPDWCITACDISAAALAVASSNAERLGLANIDFVVSDWFDALAGQRFDLIVSNPPYVPQNDPHLSSGDVRFEPPVALASGADGLNAIRHLLDRSANFLRPGGRLVFEHGYDQEKAVFGLPDRHIYDDIVQKHDLAGLPRMTSVRRL